MSLKLFTKSSNSTQPRFFAVEINQQSAKAAIWQENSQNQIEVIKVSEPITFTDQNPDSILEALDFSISTIEDNKKLIDKVIFGLDTSWVDANGIKSDKRTILKHLCDQLQLKPLGFVISFDAIMNFVNQKQDNPISAIFCQFYQENLVFNLVRLAKVVATQTIKRTDNISTDFDNAFKIFAKHGTLPEKIYLYDSNIDFETIKQQLIQDFSLNHSYFSKEPDFQSFDSPFSIKATALIGGHELIRNQKSRIDTAESQTDQSSSPESSHSDSDSSLAQEKSQSSELSLNLDNPLDTDIDLPPDFAVGQDIDDPKPPHSSFIKKLTSFKFKKTQPNPDTPNSIISADNSLQLKNTSSSKKFYQKPWFYFGIAGILIALGFLSVIYFYQSKTRVEIILAIAADTIEDTLNITASNSVDQIDFDNYIVPYEIQTITVEGSETIPTTGTVQVGEKSQGKVVIYNKTKNPRTFTKDRILVSQNNLRYQLLSDIEIASASAETSSDGESENLIFGKAEVEIEASAIGPDYNLSENSNFTLKDISSDQFTAKAVTDISGGTSEEKMAVSQRDIENLTELITQTLITQGQAELEQKLGSQLFILKESDQTKLINPVFDAQLASQAETLTVTASLNLETFVAKQSDFKQITSQALKAKIGNNYSPNFDDFNTQVIDASADSDDIIVKVKASAALKPKIDLAQLKLDLVGQNLNYANNRLRSQSNYQTHQITFSPTLSQKLNRLPTKPENITIKLKD